MATEPALRQCVILAAGDAARLEQLMQSLEQRGMTVTVAVDAIEAMAALAVGGPHALIVQDPPKHRNLKRLLAAVRRYHPLAVCRQYSDDAGLQPLGETPPEEPVAAPKPPRRAPAASAQLSPDELAMLLGGARAGEEA